MRLHLASTERIAVAILLAGSAWIAAGMAGGAPTVVADGPHDWQVWLDGPIPTDAQPGSTVHIGFIAWDAAERSTVNLYGFEVHLHPKAGNDAVTIGEVEQDWPGHSTTDLIVPSGGFGRLEFGVDEARGLAGGSSHTLTLDFRSMPVAGIGPPPDISLRRIGTVAIQPTAPAIVGQPFDVDLTFEPRIGWPPGSASLPKTLTLRIRVPRADANQEVTATLVDALGGRYRASVLVDQPGPYVLEAATRPSAPPDERFTETETRVVVERADAQSTAAAPAAPPAPAPSSSGIPATDAAAARPAPSDPGPPVLVLGLVALVIAGGTLALVRLVRAEW